MTGLQQIIDQIMAKAQAEAAAIVAEAKSQAEELRQSAEQESDRITAGILKKSASDVENEQKRVESANDLYRRNETLRRKQQAIGEVVDAAYDKVCSLDDAAYFGMLEKMINKYALSQDGEICFSSRDLARMPADYSERIKAAAAQVGGTLAISDESRPIDNGFVLIYGGIEENCTIRALFDAKKDEMLDLINNILFA